jgi:uncharacterized membrane protein
MTKSMGDVLPKSTLLILIHVPSTVVPTAVPPSVLVMRGSAALQLSAWIWLRAGTVVGTVVVVPFTVVLAPDTLPAASRAFTV